MKTSALSLNLEDQRAALERLRDMLDQAKALYESAQEAFDMALAKYKKSGGIPPHQVMHAAAVRDSLRKNYSRALEEFTEQTFKSLGTIKSHSA